MSLTKYHAMKMYPLLNYALIHADNYMAWLPENVHEAWSDST